MKIFDTFPFRDELDLIELRLYELQEIPNLVHVVVEADVDHQGHPKPYVLSENLDRFDQWADRLRVVRASGLPTTSASPDPWAREHAQREWCGRAIEDAEQGDIVLHGDVDEIPRSGVVRNMRPTGMIVLEQTLYCFAVDWQHPDPWRGTVVARAAEISSFASMRDSRNTAAPILDAGWHLSWLGTTEENLAKLQAFCHPEIADSILEGLTADRFLTEGWHVDGKKLIPVDVDDSWPRWIAEGHAPLSWFRPR